MKKLPNVKALRRHALAAALGVTLSFAAFTGPTALAAPEVPVDTSGIESYDGGRLPAGLDSSYYTLPQDTNGIAPRSREAQLPEKYDLREQGLVTGIRNQNPWGSCWSFGNTSSIESNAVRQGAGNAGSLDYSEHYMAWFTFQPYEGEGYRVVANQPIAMNFGGRRQMATADTTAWFGPVAETLVPYVNTAGELGTPDEPGDWSLPESLRNPDNDEVHVQNVDYLPETGIFDAEDNYSFDAQAQKIIKQALMENGVLDVSYYAGKSLPGQEGEAGQIFNTKEHAQYSPQKISANHEVSVVGWDDSYPADNFIIKPTDESGNKLNGAWIIKNSWGPGTGGDDWVDAEGYFYISYYDQTITEFSSYQVDVEENGLFSYDNNYQYDYLGYKSFSSLPPSAGLAGSKVANVFTAEKDEVLKAVSAITVDTDSQVDVEIYRLAAGADLSNAGEALSRTTAYPTYGGYHTIALDTPVELKAGERFAVVETITGRSGGYLPIEMGYSGELEQASGGRIQAIAKIEPGQSYIYGAEQDGRMAWSDMIDMPLIPSGDETVNFGNAMIKAFTVDKDAAPAVTLNVESLGQDGQSLGSQTVTDFSAPVVLPDNTQQIALTSSVQNGTASLSVDGAAYTEGTPISPDSVVTIDTTSQPRGNSGAQYTLSFKVIKVLSDNQVTITGTGDLLPPGATFSATALEESALPEAARTNLKNSFKAFTLYQVKTLNSDHQPLTLPQGRTVAMSFPLPEGYDAAKTGVHLVNEDGSLTPLATTAAAPAAQTKALRATETEKAGTVLNVDTAVLNGTYAIALEKEAAPGGGTTDNGSGATPLDGGGKTTGNVLTGILETPQYAGMICLAALALIFGGAYLCRRRKSR
ncbi:lectin like domain-containing protein [Eubacterium sp. 1001713B170207_170306_E7]|uniref:lectin like domain-containing protein n=1 Tax=Eubacterium sp. 1001713B170207_170306_E7 TaxID=2787097 RepID=UPI00189722C1|nr:lectin like domain-containing protein [Eubacterium sp. 1001713B170207_170306_E7]